MNEMILEISAFGVALFCFVDCLKNRKELYLPLPKGLINKLKDQHFIYLSLLVTLMLSSVSSVLEVGMEKYFAFKSILIMDLLNEIYFVFHTLLSLMFTLYIISMTKALKKKGKKFFYFFTLPVIVAELMVITNPFTRLLFYIDENMQYNRGSFMWVLYAVAVFYVLYGIGFFLKNMSSISKLDRTSTFILMSIAVLGIAIQCFFSITVELFFEAIGFLGFMLLLEVREGVERLGKNPRMNKSFIIVIALIFLTVIAMNINLIYHAGTDQGGRIGETQINNLKGELQQTISDSESHLLRYSIGLEQLINEEASLEDIETYIRDQKKNYADMSSGACFNVYAAAPEWTIIPDFDMPQEYHAVERVWYTGAKKSPGKVYISEPYIDADTGMLCYTFSNILSDSKTVVAMDYTLGRVQDIVSRMAGEEEQFAMIVTENGMIVGCSEDTYQGAVLSEVLPKYTDIFERVKASNEHRSFNTKIDGSRKIVFGSGTSNGWRLILVVDHSAFFAEMVNRMIMLGAVDLLMVAVIIVFYMVSINNQQRAEDTLAATKSFIASLSEDLRDPLNQIMRISDSYSMQSEQEGAFREISSAGVRLKEKLDNLFSYSSILRSDDETEDTVNKKKHIKGTASSRFIRNAVTGILIVAMFLGLAMFSATTSRWGAARISREADRYNNEVTLWMQQKQSILRMFADVIAADPKILDDYDAAVAWLDEVAKNYSEMTFAYMANPYNTEHAIIMNNGWVPDSDYKVEERQWYIDTERSGDGYSISAPYFDAQTGLYCITFSRIVYSSDGEFLGIFAIDCLLDKLIDVLDDSYSGNSYAFMVDQDGIIINHPDKQYEISTTRAVNIEDTQYADVYHKGDVFWMKDHDGRAVTCCARKSTLSGFTVIVVQNWWSIYGTLIIVGLVFLLLITGSILAVLTLINRFAHWQEETNEKLVKAADTAVAAEKAKSRFLAQMSHEIRTPINAVLGMNEMILRESDDESIRDYAGNIRSAGRNLLGLINTILDFSKIEEGKMEIIPVRYDTASMISTIINSVSQRAEDKGLLFEAHIDSDLPLTLFGDDMRVTQVAVNLLTNAVKYTREGRVDLYISGERDTEGSLSLRMSVKDTGIGIKEEDIGRLFESFTRLEEKRNRSIEGTGLGMAIVNRLLKMMDSTLEVESEYGKGSTFSFTVKQNIVDAAPIGDYEIKAKEAKDKEDDDKYVYAPDARLLAVDDNDMNLKVITNLLKLNGIVPDRAASGAAALDKLKNNKYDIVLLDHMMPQMDGIETLQRAKEGGLIQSGCAVIALTANAVVGAREKYLEAGFDDYLSKPVEVPALESILKKYLAKDKWSVRSRSDKAGSSIKDSGKAASVSSEKTGLDTEEGLKYCAGDEAFYHELLRDYLDSYPERSSELSGALTDSDMHTYAIKVHALKSVSRTIGATQLSEMAADLERYAKEGDMDKVNEYHPQFIEELKRIVALIEGMDLSQDGASAEEDDDADVIEFFPNGEGNE